MNLIKGLNLEKCDVFSLGLTFLHLITVQDIKKFNKNEEKVKIALMNVKNEFGEKVSEFLQMMLEFEPNKRKNFEELQLEINELKKSKIVMVFIFFLLLSIVIIKFFKM